MTWSALLSSKEFWTALTAGIPLITMLVTTCYKFFTGEGSIGKNRIKDINEIIKDNECNLSEEDKKYLSAKLNELVMYPHVKIKNAESRSKWVYLQNRSGDNLDVNNYKWLLPFIQAEGAHSVLRLNTSTKEYKTRRFYFELGGCSLFFMGSTYIVMATGAFGYFPFPDMPEWPRVTILGLSVFYFWFAKMMFFRFPREAKADRINSELLSIQLSNGQLIQMKDSVNSLPKNEVSDANVGAPESPPRSEGLNPQA
ncbi:hypothetical protein SerAS12_2714 [Serratia sp. AS12]|uniref:hypothetical protein n=1 Tax=Serratia TaxID=613 RepID=UPI00020EA0C2|nr:MULTISPECIES: hypothetical protein [Serratia]AEF45834.1 hypothetical protein SerAS9_2713 [Serratia plymuthica AS9]AEF50785.1 hypothetical protein SerAS12_2714 [Serratia sp. AS12]AEG28492.1 hypothetical protein SerAS13_2715 [Serratia sp. AS13]UTN94592.1 hypothetical protein NLX81_13830 [Serratia plymuthica]